MLGYTRCVRLELPRSYDLPELSAKINRASVNAYEIPTETPESDGTLEWDATTLVVVQLHCGKTCGIGYTYADVATAKLIESKLLKCVRDRNVTDIGTLWASMVSSIRNLGRPGIASMAISAVDNALWDLNARLIERPLYSMLGATRSSVPIYGSGGFTSYTVPELQAQLAGWVADGIPRVKMKIGRDPAADVDRVRAARAAIGNDAELFVDANGAYTVKEALEFAQLFLEFDVSWFEEPVYHRDVRGLRFVRDHAPPPIEVSAGEYGYDPFDFERLVHAVDVVQADVTRCEGVTGFLLVDGLCAANNVPLSTHCAPAITAHAAAAAQTLRHMEYFFDHVRIERMLFDGLPKVRDGALQLDPSAHGNGLTFKHKDAERYAI